MNINEYENAANLVLSGIKVARKKLSKDRRRMRMRDFLKSPSNNSLVPSRPAKAGVQKSLKNQDFRLRGNDDTVALSPREGGVL